MFSTIVDHANKLRADVTHRVGEVLHPHSSTEDEAAAAQPFPILSTIKSKLQGTIEDAESKLLHLQTKWNKVDHDDDDDAAVAAGTSENEHNKDSDKQEAYYIGKQLVDMKRMWRQQAQEQAVKKETQQQQGTSASAAVAAATSADAAAAAAAHSKLTISHLSYSSPTAPAPSSVPSSSSAASASAAAAFAVSYYIVLSVEGQTETTSRRRPVATASSAVDWPKPVSFPSALRDPFADVYITVFRTVGPQNDRAVGRAILPLSAMLGGDSVQELARLSVRSRTKQFILHLLPLKPGTGKFVRSVDGLRLGLERPASGSGGMLGTLTLTVTLDTGAVSLLYALAAAPPARAVAPAVLLTDPFDEITLNKRKFRVARLVPAAQSLLLFAHDLVQWKSPVTTLWFLYLDFSVLFWAEAYHLPLYLAVYVVSVVFAKRNYLARRPQDSPHVPIYQDQVQQEHAEVPNTVPQKLKAVMDLVTLLQFALGILATWGERAVMSWQEDALTAVLLSGAVLGAGLAGSLVVFLVLLFPDLCRAAAFAWVLKQHVVLKQRRRRTASEEENAPAAATTATAAEDAAAAHRQRLVRNLLQRVPDATELDHRRIAHEHRVDL